jgi:hypothetical protein
MAVKQESRHEVITALRQTYNQVRRPEKQKVIDHAVEITGYDREYARRLLARGVPTKDPMRHRAGRGRTYKFGTLEVMVVAADATGWICSKRLVAALPDLLPALEKEGAIHVSPEQRAQVLSLSASTIDRRLASERRSHRPRGLSTTRPGFLLRSQVAIRTVTPWMEEVPGFLEIDLVAHCGSSSGGDFVYTLTAVDIATGWTECVAIRNRRQYAVLQALNALRRRFPYPIKGIDCDNGSEFMNAALVRYCATHRWVFTRCRPYHKNDQAHVEEKNGSLVRQLMGYDRYEGAASTTQMNIIYGIVHGYFNYYLPTLKLITKQRVGARIHKTYGTPVTPYRRAVTAGLIPDGEKTPLLGPMAARKRIDKEVTRLTTMRARDTGLFTTRAA